MFNDATDCPEHPCILVGGCCHQPAQAGWGPKVRRKILQLEYASMHGTQSEEGRSSLGRSNQPLPICLGLALLPSPPSVGLALGRLVRTGWIYLGRTVPPQLVYRAWRRTLVGGFSLLILSLQPAWAGWWQHPPTRIHGCSGQSVASLKVSK